MRQLSKVLLALSLVVFGTSCLAQAPRGKLIYCSYSRTGAAGLGKDYCELIADPGTTPKIVVALDVGNRFDKPETHAEYSIDNNVVDSLQTKLANAKVYKLNGYNVDEAITGGHSYRIYQEYDSGEKINVRWYGHKIKPEALAAYNMIEAFFQPWRSQAIKDQDKTPHEKEP